MKVRDVMKSTVVTATPETPFPELVDRLLRYGVSGLPVVNEDGQLVGIVTEADLVAKRPMAAGDVARSSCWPTWWPEARQAGPSKAGVGPQPRS